jgi:hypothetical protein
MVGLTGSFLFGGMVFTFHLYQESILESSGIPIPCYISQFA